jgi:hypothetical protein
VGKYITVVDSLSFLPSLSNFLNSSHSFILVVAVTMLSLLTLSATFAAVGATVLPIPDIVKYASYLKGFDNPIVAPTVGGHGICIQGNIPVQASAMNTQYE